MIDLNHNYIVNKDFLEDHTFFIISKASNSTL